MKSIFQQEYQAVIERLVTRRKELGISQSELARRLGREFDQSIVSKIETCVRRIDVIEAKRICEALQMEIFDLFREVE
ncbi:MAG TPA: helix-turn-helix transcriptional regulator [Rectinemataceae bacterium]|nr:helix-turn-helix transcriptional regulator [Rectinemataceae bacterium]